MVCSMVLLAVSGLGEMTGVVALGVMPGVVRALLIRLSGRFASAGLADGVVEALTGRRADDGFGSGGRLFSASPKMTKELS